MEIENCNPVEGERARFGIKLVGLLVDRRGEAGVSSSEAGLEGILQGDEIGDRKVTTELKRRSKPEGVRGRRGLKDNSHKQETLIVIGPKKRIKTNLNRGNWCHVSRLG